MKRQRLLVGLLGFNAVTAMAGGIGLIAGWIKPGAALLEHTDFASYYWPGVILLCAVGGSALYAAVSVTRKMPGASMASLLAGMIMLFWIITEVVSIRQFHFFQVVYIATSLTIIFQSGDFKK